MRAHGKTFYPPVFTVPGDDRTMTMLNNGEVVAVTEDAALWRLGFAQGSPISDCYGGINTGEGFWWVLADPDGGVKDRFHGFWYEVPKRFKDFDLLAGGPANFSEEVCGGPHCCEEEEWAPNTLTQADGGEYLQ